MLSYGSIEDVNPSKEPNINFSGETDESSPLLKVLVWERPQPLTMLQQATSDAASKDVSGGNIWFNLILQGDWKSSDFYDSDWQHSFDAVLIVFMLSFFALQTIVRSNDSSDFSHPSGHPPGLPSSTDRCAQKWLFLVVFSVKDFVRDLAWNFPPTKT